MLIGVRYLLTGFLFGSQYVVPFLRGLRSSRADSAFLFIGFLGAHVATSGSNNTQDGGRDSPFEANLPSILIVDDSQDSANILSRLFDAHGYKTHVAYDWAAALEAAKAHLPDVILLDLAMPELDGVHLARLFREDEQLRDKLLVAVTGYADEMRRTQCEAAGFDYVLTKPPAWEDLKSTVDRLWSKRKMP